MNDTGFVSGELHARHEGATSLSSVELWVFGLVELPIRGFSALFRSG